RITRVAWVTWVTWVTWVARITRVGAAAWFDFDDDVVADAWVVGAGGRDRGDACGDGNESAMIIDGRDGGGIAGPRHCHRRGALHAYGGGQDGHLPLDEGLIATFDGHAEDRSRRGTGAAAHEEREERRGSCKSSRDTS